MLRNFLMPGSLACEAVGLREVSDHRQTLRMFLNMLFWGAVSVVAAIQFPHIGLTRTRRVSCPKQ